MHMCVWLYLQYRFNSSTEIVTFIKCDYIKQKMRPSLKLSKFGLTRPARQNYRGWAYFFMHI